MWANASVSVEISCLATQPGPTGRALANRQWRRNLGRRSERIGGKKVQLTAASNLSEGVWEEEKDDPEDPGRIKDIPIHVEDHDIDQLDDYSLSIVDGLDFDLYEAEDNLENVALGKILPGDVQVGSNLQSAPVALRSSNFPVLLWGPSGYLFTLAVALTVKWADAKGTMSSIGGGKWARNIARRSIELKKTIEESEESIEERQRRRIEDAKERVRQAERKRELLRVKKEELEALKAKAEQARREAEEERRKKEEEELKRNEEAERVALEKVREAARMMKEKQRIEQEQQRKAEEAERLRVIKEMMRLHEKQVSQGRRFIGKFVGAIELVVEGNRLGTTKVTVQVKSTRVIGRLEDVGGFATIQYDTVDEAEQEAREWEGPLVATREALSRHLGELELHAMGGLTAHSALPGPLLNFCLRSLAARAAAKAAIVLEQTVQASRAVFDTKRDPIGVNAPIDVEMNRLVVNESAENEDASHGKEDSASLAESKNNFSSLADEKHEDTTWTKTKKAVDLFYQKLGVSYAESENGSTADKCDKASVRNEIVDILEGAIKSERTLSLQELDEDLGKQNSSALAKWTRSLKKNVAATVPATVSIGASLVALGDILTIALFVEMAEERNGSESDQDDEATKEQIEAIAGQAISSIVEQYPWNAYLVVGLQAIELILGSEHVCCRVVKQTILAKIPQPVDPLESLTEEERILLEEERLKEELRRRKALDSTLIPEKVWAMKNAAFSLAASGEREQAKKTLQRALVLKKEWHGSDSNPGLLEVLVPLRDVLTDMNLVEEAKEAAIEIARVLDGLGKMFETSGKFPEAGLMWAVAVFELRQSLPGADEDDDQSFIMEISRKAEEALRRSQEGGQEVESVAQELLGDLQGDRVECKAASSAILQDVISRYGTVLEANRRP